MMRKLERKKVSFVMDPYAGGGPRNVFTFSRLLNESGVVSDILSFKSPQYLDHILNRKTDNNYFGAKRVEPNHLFSLIYTITSIGDNVSELLYPIFTFNQSILKPLILSSYPKPNLYVATNWQSFTPSYLMSRKYNIPMMYFVQADESEFSNNRLYKKLAIITYTSDVQKFTHSKWLVETFQNKYETELIYIGFGIDHSKFYPRKFSEDKIIFTIARIGLTKGFSVFVKAVNRLWNLRQDFKVIIAGDKYAVNREAINFPYEFLGWIHDDEMLASLYSKSIFVSTGLNETLPMPPLEAMACGGCVVMSLNGGSSEYANDNENCLLTTPGNDKELTEKLNFILSQNSLRENLRSGAINTAKRYDWEKVVNKVVSLIKKKIG